MAHDVFISHSHHDKTAADAACAALEARGIRCWIAPRDIDPGKDWAESIVDAIRGAQIMLLVFSRHANGSNQVKREVERAASSGKVLLPLRIDDVVPEASLEYYLGTPHWLDAMTPPLEAHLGRLADACSSLLAVDGSAPRPTSNAPFRPAPPQERGTSPSVLLAVIGSVVAVLAVIGIVSYLLMRPVEIQTTEAAPTQKAQADSPTSVAVAAPPPASTTSTSAGVPGMEPFVGIWQAHTERLVIDGAGNGHLNYKGCTACATQTDNRVDFTLTSVSNGIAGGNVVSSSDPYYESGMPVSATITPASPGHFLALTVNGLLQSPLCDVAAQSTNQCGA
ncbi:TIR domain-containing protein [Mycolicibacterium sp. 120270]|uniref:TIR domain-containing protein n=1 Tax=Mycolicibacterium sp. 120270 TaxID=3090600 RepID=UPI00299EB27C|nr:TIR domain-containing protein [Mycolicibacterium sp. 120270]MDX1882092.1 TIR domain-containing protein [Mycolicibacterium sp. 120270]